MDIINEIKASFKRGSYLTQLIYINFAIFIIVNLFSVGLFLFGLPAYYSPLISWLALPAETGTILVKFWTIISYMFLHEGFGHILLNMIILFWFGKMFLEHLDQKQLLSVYLLGGISGGLTYIIAYNTFPIFSEVVSGARLLGASASVMAVVFAISFYIPNREVYIPFINRVKLKYISIVAILLSVIWIPDGNAGGQFAHIGGALFGYWFIYQYKKGKLITKGFDKWLDKIFTWFKPRSKMKVTYKKTGNPEHDYNAKKAGEQVELNKILEKISKSGYSSLSKEEKETLFKMSDKK